MVLSWVGVLAWAGAAPGALLCPQDMVFVSGGAGVLGQYRAAHGEDQVPPVSLEVGPFCVGIYPLPGRAGDHWPADGLEGGDVARLEGGLLAVGVRLCTAEELVWVTAGGAENRPYATGSSPPRSCEPSFSWPDMKPYDSWKECVSPWGLRDLHVASSWATASARIDEARMAYRRRPYVVVGGTNRLDTFYAPTNFGHHLHDPGDPPFFDDQVRACATPGAVDAARWELLKEAMAAQGSYVGFLDWLGRYGVDASPTDILEDHRIYLRDD